MVYSSSPTSSSDSTLHLITHPVDSTRDSPSLQQSSGNTTLDSEDTSSAADPLLGSHELNAMGKGSDDGLEAEEIEHLDVAPIHHSAAVWETRETYGPAGKFRKSNIEFNENAGREHRKKEWLLRVGPP